jgi:hypothetical protein
MPQDYKTLFENILQTLGQIKVPIIIIEVNHVKDIEKLQKHLNMRDFIFKFEGSYLVIDYKLAMWTNENGTVYISKSERFNLENNFATSFALNNLSGYLILTNSPKYALLQYLYIRNMASLDPTWHLYQTKLFEYILFLIGVELKTTPKKPKFDQVNDLFEIKLNFLNYYRDSTLMINIIKQIVNISYFPRIKEQIDLQNEINIIKKSIFNDIHKNITGFALLWFLIDIFLYSIITNDLQFRKKFEQFTKLFTILEQINGKDINLVFYKNLIEYLDSSASLYGFKESLSSKLLNLKKKVKK